MEEAPGKKMGWTGAWRIANVTAASAWTSEINKQTNGKKNKQTETRNSLPQAVGEPESGDRGESGVGDRSGGQAQYLLWPVYSSQGVDRFTTVCLK